MGWIRVTSPSHAQSVHKIAAKIEVDHQKESLSRVEHSPEAALQDDSYPILPKRTIEVDLPLINANDVKKRDGKDGRRLCTSSHLPTFTIFSPNEAGGKGADCPSHTNW
jgi:hypothetical protein